MDTERLSVTLLNVERALGVHLALGCPLYFVLLVRLSCFQNRIDAAVGLDVFVHYRFQVR